VLIGATVVPVWSRNVRLLPIHFAFSALGTASSILQLRGHDHPALHRIGVAAALVETAIGAGLEIAPGRANEPVKHGTSGWLMRASGLLSGPIPLLLRTLGRRSPAAQRAAAISTIAGSLLTRYGWIAAGRSSAVDPREPLNLPAGAKRTAPDAIMPSPISRTQAPLTVTER
jgi:peptidoglycan/LPS O-acetylase OafA/YrhL